MKFLKYYAHRVIPGRLELLVKVLRSKVHLKTLFRCYPDKVRNFQINLLPP